MQYDLISQNNSMIYYYLFIAQYSYEIVHNVNTSHAFLNILLLNKCIIYLVYQLNERFFAMIFHSGEHMTGGLSNHS